MIGLLQPISSPNSKKKEKNVHPEKVFYIFQKNLLLYLKERNFRVDLISWISYQWILREYFFSWILVL